MALDKQINTEALRSVGIKDLQVVDPLRARSSAFARARRRVLVVTLLSAGVVVGVSPGAASAGPGSLPRTSAGCGPTQRVAGFCGRATESSVTSPAASSSGSAIVPGFNTVSFPGNDDGSTAPINLPFTMNLFGRAYSSLYVNNNGNLTFTAPLSTYTPVGLAQLGMPMIAPFWADVDTRTGPVVTYGTGSVSGHEAFGVNWLGVGCYDEISSVANYFQVLLIDRPDIGVGDFDVEFNYGPMTWDSGQASGSNSQCLGGTPARAGYTNGAGTTFEIPGSGVSGGLLSNNALTGLSRNSINSSVIGRYVFPVRGGGTPQQPYYVALGDSYSSGVGTYDYDSRSRADGCNRSVESWPYQLTADFFAVPTVSSATFFACSGATTQNLQSTGQNGEPSQLSQLRSYEAANGDPALVTVTVGGDNAGINFAPLLKGCVIVGASQCLGSLNARIAYMRSGAFTTVLADTYRQIRSDSGSAPVVVVGYPFLFPAAGLSADLSGDFQCVWLDGDAAQIFARFREGQQLLDAVEVQAAEEAGVEFVPLDDVFAGHELCTGDPYINPLDLGSGHGHPTTYGYQLMAQRVGSELGYAANPTFAPIHKSVLAAPAVKKAVPGGNVVEILNPPAARVRSSSTNRAGASLSIGQAVDDGVAGVPYTGYLWPVGGTGPYSWSITGGSLPGGLTLDAASGIISGTPSLTGSSTATISVTDSSSPPEISTATVTIAVDPLPALTMSSGAIPTATVGEQFFANPAASGGAHPYTWSVSAGSLPAGLSLNSSTGALTGTPSTVGSSTFALTVVDSGSPPSNVTRSYTINTVAAATPLQLQAPASTTNVTAGTGFVIQLSASGGTGPLSWTVSKGVLPDGIALDQGTGLISGTPTDTGSFPVTIEVQDASTPTPQAVTGNLTISVAAAGSLTVTAPTLPDPLQGATYEEALDAGGGIAPLSWTVTSGSLPPGLSLDAASGEINGTPTTPGTYPFEVAVTDSATPTVDSAIVDETLTVDAAPTIAPLSLSDTVTDGVVGSSYQASVMPLGGTSPYTFSIGSGSLPPGLTLDSVAGTITGVPSAAGTYDATIVVSDSSSPTQTANDPITITMQNPAALAIATSTLDDAAVGGQYATEISVTGGVGPYSYTVTNGSLPDGLSLDPNTGDLAGAPTSTGSSAFTITVTDSAPSPDTVAQTFTLTTDNPSPVSIVTVALPDAVQGAGYLQTLYATGGTAPYSWMITSGSLPNGLALDPSSGNISGSATDSGTFTFTVGVSDSTATVETATESVTLTIDPGAPLTIATSTLDAAMVGSSFSGGLDASGGTQPLQWAVSSGSLPSGLSLDPNAGLISGTPTAAGNFTFTVTASDSTTPSSETASQELTLEVEPVPLSPSTTSVSVTPETASYGEPVTLNATVAASTTTSNQPTGTVKFYDGSTLLGSSSMSSGSALLASSALAIGNHEVTASYSGDGNFFASASGAPVVLTVNKASSVTTLSLATGTITYGAEQLTRLSATVIPGYTGKPAGTVTIRSGTATLCSFALSGGSGFCLLKPTQLQAGRCSFVAYYAGNADFNPSTSKSQLVTIAKASSMTALSISTPKITYGNEQVERFSVVLRGQFAGTTPTGTATIKSGTNTICQAILVNGKGSCVASSKALTVGSHTVTAAYSGSANFNTSTSPGRTVIVVA